MWTGATAADLALFFFPIFPHTSRRITLQTPNLRYTHDPLSPTSEARAVYVALQRRRTKIDCFVFQLAISSDSNDSFMAIGRYFG
jgi:hypothetical protein